MTIMQELSTKSALAPSSLPEITPGLRSGSDEWKLDGVCRTVDPDLWFPDSQASGSQAKKLCRSCPVIDECLQYALKHNEKHGVWGGLSRHERIKLRRRLGLTRFRKAI